MRAILLCALLACSRDLTVPPLTDTTPPSFTSVSATPAYAAAGATVTLTFQSSEPLAGTPTATFAGGPMACNGSSESFVCTARADAALGEGPRGFTIAGRDAAGNQAAPFVPAAQVVLDFTPPTLAVSAGAPVASKGEAISFAVEASEPLGEAPGINAPFLSGTALCSGPVPGDRFVCTGAQVDAAAASGPASFTASGVDRAGNPATSPAATVTLADPILPPPLISVGDVTPAVVKAGDKLTFTVSSNEPLTSCVASVAGQVASCTLSSEGCSCAFTVPVSLLEGNNLVLAFGANRNGTGTGSAGVQVDNTAPVVSAAKFVLTRNGLGTNESISAGAGAAADSQGVPYAARTVKTLRLWSKSTGGAALATVTPLADGSFAQLELLLTTGLSGEDAPAQVFASAVDLAGNESARTLVAGDPPASGDGSAMTIARRAVGAADGVSGDSGAFTQGGCALRSVAVFAAQTGGAALGQGALAGDGSFTEVAVGTSTHAPAQAWVSAIDKCAVASPRVAAETGAETAPPFGDGTLAAIVRRPLGQKDGVAGSAGALYTGTGGAACDVASVKIYSYDPDLDDFVLQASGPAHDDGSWDEIPVGAPDASFAQLYFSGVDKCGLEDSQHNAIIAGSDDGPLLDGTLALLTLPGGGAAATVRGSLGAALPGASALTGLHLSDDPLGEHALTADFTPAADGSFTAQTLSSAPARAYLFASDKSGVVTIAVVQRESFALDLVGRAVRSGPGPSVFPLAADQDPRSASPGQAIASAPEVDPQGAAAIDGSRLVTSASSQTQTAAPHWTQLGGPPARTDAALVYDPVRQKLVLFGGTAGGAPFAETWLYDGTAWQVLPTAHSPPARSGHAMVWDGARIVLFGGFDGAGTLSDTWAFDGNDWSDLTAGLRPLARQHHGMAFDGSRIVLFGGLAAADTWAFAGGAWSQLVPDNSPPSNTPGPDLLAWDGAHVVLFGNGTWTFDGSTWTQHTTPPGMTAACLAFDSARTRVVAAGGGSTSTWEWSGSAWTSTAAAQIVSARTGCSLAFDGARTVLFGGAIGTVPLGDTLAWNGTVWTALDGAPPGDGFGAAAYDTARGKVVVFGGGTASPTRTFEFDGARWTTLHTTTTPFPRIASAMAFDPARGAMVMFAGATPTGGFRQDTWEYSGGNWQSIDASPPFARSGHSMTYDPLSGRIILFGGSVFGSADHDTWAYAGGDWTQLSPAHLPPARTGHTAMFDPVRGQVVVSGGLNASHQPLSDTWAFDGADWAQVTTTGSPAARGSAGLSWDFSRGLGVLFGGTTTAAALADLWELSGSDWSQDTLPGPRARSGLVAVSTPGGVFFAGGREQAGGAVTDAWSWSGQAPHPRMAAQVFSFALDPLASLQALSATYVGAGSGASGAGVELLAWNGASWTSLGVNSALDSDAAAARTITGSPPDAASSYIGRGYIFLLAVGPPSAPGTDSALSTDYLRVQLDVTLPP